MTKISNMTWAQLTDALTKIEGLRSQYREGEASLSKLQAQLIAAMKFKAERGDRV